jgi:hypothetical protein
MADAENSSKELKEDFGWKASASTVLMIQKPISIG